MKRKVKAKPNPNKPPTAKPTSKPKKKVEPLLAYARSLRQTLRARHRKLGISVDDIPTGPELYKWLKAQEPFECYYTSNPVKLKSINVDHKKPLSMGGTSTLDNLCVTSARTNKAKGAFTEIEFKDLLRFCRKYPSAGNYLFSRLLRGFMCARRD